MMELVVNNVGEEIVEETAKVLVENVPEEVVAKAGMSLAKKAGIVGGVIVVGGAVVYGTVKLVKKLKAKNNVEGDDNTAENAESETEINEEIE